MAMPSTVLANLRVRTPAASKNPANQWLILEPNRIEKWGCPGFVDTDQGSAVVSVRAQVYSCS